MTSTDESHIGSLTVRIKIAREIIQSLAVEGTAAELDTELASTLVSYTAEHLSLTRSIEQVKASMEAALKEVKDEAAPRRLPMRRREVNSPP